MQTPTLVFEVVPLECISSILTFLPFCDRVQNASHVCKLFVQALQHPMCWTRIDLKRSNVTTPMNSLKRSFPVIFGARSCITDILLEEHRDDSEFSKPYVVGSTPCRDMASALCIEFSAMKKLHHLLLSQDHRFTGDLSLNLPNLISFELNAYQSCPYLADIIKPATLPRIDLSGCPSLKWCAIDCNDVPLKLVLRGLSSLTLLHVFGDELTEIEGLFNLPSLQELRLFNCERIKLCASDISDDGASAITCASMQDLDILDVGGASSTVANVFLRNASRMPVVRKIQLPSGVRMPEIGCLATWQRLTSLTIREYYKLTEACMRAIGSVSSLRKLVFVNFYGCLAGGDHVIFLEDFMDKFPLEALCSVPSCKIEELKFDNCPGIVSGSLQSLHMLSSLTELSISGCDNLHLPLALSRCTTLTKLYMHNSNRDLSDTEAYLIASLPNLKTATLPAPSSQSCVQRIARCPSLQQLRFYSRSSSRFPHEWLTHLPPTLHYSTL